MFSFCFKSSVKGNGRSEENCVYGSGQPWNGLPLVAQRYLPAVQETQVHLDPEDPLEEEMATHSSIGYIL